MAELDHQHIVPSATNFPTKQPTSGTRTLWLTGIGLHGVMAALLGVLGTLLIIDDLPEEPGEKFHGLGMAFGGAVVVAGAIIAIWCFVCVSVSRSSPRAAAVLGVLPTIGLLVSSMYFSFDNETAIVGFASMGLGLWVVVSAIFALDSDDAT